MTTRPCEPYRVLFPVGATLGILGVMLWPGFVYGWLPMYPGVAHARIMVQGFLFSFMAGFLGSALPHMLEVKGMSWARASLLAFLLVSLSILHAAGLTSAGDWVFVSSVALLLLTVSSQWSARADLPPPGMVLAVAGITGGAIGTVIMALAHPLFLSPGLYHFGQLLLYHGMVILPVLGAGVYLMPRMVGLPNRHMIRPASRIPSGEWWTRAGFMAVCGLVILGGLVLEARGLLRLGRSLVAVTFAGCFLHEVPLYRTRAVTGTIPRNLVAVFVFIAVGYAASAWSHRAVSYVHLAFVTGFGLLVLNIGTRVILGHSGQTDEIYAVSRVMRWITGLAILTVVTRISADLIPAMQWSHYAYAGIAWAMTLLLWIVVYGPLVRLYPSSEAGDVR